MDTFTNKHQVYNKLQQIVKNNIQSINEHLDGLHVSLKNETKNSAGDKYETGRAMVHQEIDKAKNQLSMWLEKRVLLASISIEKVRDTIQFGSYVETDKGCYFFSSGFGEIDVNGKKIIALGCASPLGQAFLGKKVGDKVSFRQNQFEITVVE